MLDEDLDLKAKIVDVFECAAKDVIALVEARREVEKCSAEPLPEWMTAAQLARYWQLVNANGAAITAGIMKWTKRPENEHPLPHACMGDLLRFKREEVDRWAQEEAAFRRAEKNRKKLHLAS
jgi:ATP-dependent exoDNAse (exonuclease V) beta subunit